MTIARHLRRPASVLVVALLLLLLTLGVGGAASADDGTGSPSPSPDATATESDPTARADTLKFGIGPARDVPKNQVVDGRPYLVYVADPGATLTDAVKLLNFGDKPLTVQLYATDAVQGIDGGFGLLPAAKKPKGAGSWIVLAGVPADGKVTIPARTAKAYGQLTVPLTASVPADATPGDHVGGVIASVRSTGTNSQGDKVTLDQRIGLRTYFHVNGALKPSLTIDNLKASYQEQHDPLGRGRINVTYTVHNTGNIRLNAAQTVSVSRMLLGGVTHYPATLQDILPGGRVIVHQTFEHAFGFGPLTAKVTLHPTAVDPTFTQSIPSTAASTRFWAWPWLFIAIIAGVVLLLLGLYAWNQRRKRRKGRLTLVEGAAPPSKELSAQGAGANKRGAAPVARPGLRAAAFLAAFLVALGPLAIGMRAAQAEPPKGSLGEVMFETGNTTGVPASAIIDGWWGHEGGKNGNGTGTTFISMNAADDTGAVTDASIAALHKALGDEGTFDQLRVAFVPYSADGSQERPPVTKGENVADVYPWFADRGMGSPLTGSPNDSVATVSTGAEYKKWWDAGQPLQGYTKDLGVVDIADDSSTRPAAAPQGKSILDRWPAGQKISMVLYLSDGTDKTRPGLPTVAVGPDGRAMASWLTFRTVADPDDPSRSSAGYHVLTGKGTGTDAPKPPGDPVQTGPAAPSGASTSGAGAGGSASPGDGDGGGATDEAGPSASTASPGVNTAEGDRESQNAVISAFPGGTPMFVLLLVLLMLGAAGWATWWLRSGRSGTPQQRL
jgi:hypothetical protein